MNNLTPEEKAALERLRKHRYQGYDAAGDLAHDQQILAIAFLREHPVDDDEPVTEEWLVDCGFVTDGPEDDYYNIVRLAQLSVGASDLHGSTSWCMRGMEFMRPFTTRGDVRRLCQALGIELKEKPND